MHYKPKSIYTNQVGHEPVNTADFSQMCPAPPSRLHTPEQRAANRAPPQRTGPARMDS